ncbi:MAG: ComEC/Rec2 family competence protein [Acidimicrobiia bacterium]
MIRDRTRAGPFAILTALVVGMGAGENLGSVPGAPTFATLAVLAVIAALLRPSACRVVVVLVIVAILGAALTQRALHRLNDWPLAPAVAERADATIQGNLIDDPDGTRFSTQVLVRLERARLADGRWRNADGRIVLVVAEDEAAPRVAILDAGDQVTLRGWLRPLELYDGRFRWRHAAARFDASSLAAFDGPDAPHVRVANAIRRVVLHGSATLPPTERALVAGFLLGDTRALPDDVLERFRAGGLSHLLAVSGANVAFTLGLLGPLLRRLSRGPRLGATLAVLGVFGAMTRWEPSVMRACAMAACAVVAIHLGRPARTTRVLAIAVTVLLVLDPFLLHSVGFQLSCGASLGIALLAAPFAARLRGPQWLREGLATTAAAQIGVAPVLLPVFGSMPLVALPANLLAVPIAGPLTMWGLASGAVAGVLGPAIPGLAATLQVPTRFMADAMLGIADAAAHVPFAVDVRGAVALGAFVLVAAIARRGRMLRRDALVVPPR